MKHDRENIDLAFWAMLVCALIFCAAFWYTVFWAGILIGTIVVLAGCIGFLFLIDSEFVTAKFKRTKP